MTNSTSEREERLREIRARLSNGTGATFSWNYGHDVRFLLSLLESQAATLHYFKPSGDGRCVACGNLKLWQYHIDEELDPATSMRNLCVEKVKSMRDTLPTTARSWEQESRQNTQLKTCDDIITALQSLTLEQEQK